MDVSIRSAGKEFDGYAALHEVSLDIHAGELIALLGPSGSGKTTLLRLIAGLERPSAGSICFAGSDASLRTVQERNVGFVFQHYALFRHMTVLDNIGFGLSVRPRKQRASRAEIRRRAAELLELVQLPGLGERYPNQLSGGQRQRVALARALAIEPRILLLDEPFGALDAQVRRDLRRWLREIHDTTGHTTVFVTHDQEEALELADRLVVMNQGRIEQIGTPDAVYDDPASPFVYGFIGESSAIPVELDKGAVLFERRRTGLEAPGRKDGAALLNFRPHTIERVTSGPGQISGTVLSSRRVAGGRRLELETASACRVEIELPADQTAPVGSQINFKPRSWKLFDAATESAAA